MPQSPVDRGPLFVGGAERSGTTFVAAELAQRAGLTFLPEALFLAPCIHDDLTDSFSASRVASSWRLRSWGPDVPQLTSGITDGMSARECFAAVVSNYSAAIGVNDDRSAHRWVEHSPHNLRYIASLSKAYPDAVFVHVVRDGRAVYSSARNTNFGPLGPVDAANRWLRQVSWGLAAEALTNRVIRVRYEDVVGGDGTELDQIINAIGAEDRSTLINVGSLTSRQHSLVASPPDPNRVNAWQESLPKRSIQTFEALAGPTLEMLGYPLMSSATHISQPGLYTRQFGSSAAQLFYRIPRRHLTHAMFRLTSRLRERGQGRPGE